MDRITFAYLDVDGRIDLKSFFCVSLCICIFGFTKIRMLNHKIDYVIQCTFMKLELEKVTIENTEDENKNSNCLFDKLYLLKIYKNEWQ